MRLWKKRIVLAAATLAALDGDGGGRRGDDACLCATAAAGVRAPGLTIRYEAVGCHSWSLNGGMYTVEHDLQLKVGQSLRGGQQRHLHSHAAEDKRRRADDDQPGVAGLEGACAGMAASVRRLSDRAGRSGRSGV